MPQANQRQPIPYRQDNARNLEIVRDVPPADRVIHLADEAKELRTMSTISAASTVRRLFFVWFRVYVHEVKYGKHEKVNLKIPLPIPLIGAVFARQLSFSNAARLAAQARRGEDVGEYLDSAMGLEFVRVHEDNDKGKSQLVVVGLD